MLSSKENTLRTIHGEKAEYVPLSYTEIVYGGFFAMDAVGQPLKDGTDIFGVPWIYGKEGGMPDPRRHPLHGIEDWRSYLPKMPDLSEIDFKELARKEKEAANYDPESKVYTVMDDGGCFMRLTYLMGIGDACISLIEEPEECFSFFEEYANWKIDYWNRVIDAYNPDVVVYGNDIASASSLLFSKDMYREMVKPFDQRIAEAIISRGVVVDFHSCGKIEELIGDYVEMGVKMWQSAQPMNDLVGILDRYSGKITVGGGWDTAGPAGYLEPDTSEEVLREEVRRCLATYKKPGFILFPCVYNDTGNIRKVGDPRVGALIDEWEKNKWF